MRCAPASARCWRRTRHKKGRRWVFAPAAIISHWRPKPYSSVMAASRLIATRNGEEATMASVTTANGGNQERLDFADMRRRLTAIFIGSIGNLVEWYDFYAYAAFALYFAGAFFPNSD